MNNYELNKKLASLLGLEVSNELDEDSDGVIIIDSYCDDYSESIVDYCCNWNDISPVANDLYIGCEHVDGFGWVSTYKYDECIVANNFDQRLSLVECCIKVLSYDTQK